MSWEDMTGDDRVRACGQCKLSVYNLTKHSRAEIEQFISAREGKVCVRIYQRGDGTGLTQDCPDGRRRFFIKAAVGMLAMVAVSLTLWLLVENLDRTRLHLPDWLQTLLDWAPHKPRVTMGTPCPR